MVARDIKLARYTDSKLHLTGITTAKSLEYVRRAKEAGLKVTCSVTPYHLFFTDEDVQGYDTNLKVNLPLRTKADVDALRRGVEDGTIDCVATHHQPHEWDSKTCEFEYAKPGMIGLETCYGVLATIGFSTDVIARVLSAGPRNIIGLYNQGIKEKVAADLTMFVTNQPYQVTNDCIRSKSRNTPFLDKTLKGKVVGIVNKDGLYLNN